MFNKSIDLRMIEHSLCESYKYNKAVLGSGRPRNTFRRSTKDVLELI